MLDPTRSTFSRFGGLRLDTPLDEVGGDQAIYLRDVDWDGALGKLRSRDGFQKLKAAAASGDYTGLFADNSVHMLAIKRATASSAKIVSLDHEGEETAEATWSEVAGKPTFVRFGTPAASYIYARAGGVAGHAVMRFDGTAFTTPTATVDGVAGKAMPQGAFMVAWPDGGNRLLVANTGSTGGPNGAASSGSHVWISDAGNAESWHTVEPEANYLQLSPGDGESITGMCVWGGQVFIFKETQFFVLWGVSEGPKGAPDFNIRSVQLGKGSIIKRATAPTLEESSDQLCSASPDGIYFATTNGIFITNGGAPSKISNALRPLEEEAAFDGPMADFLDGSTEVCRWPASGLFVLGSRLYVRRYEYLFIFDIPTQEWLCWKMTATSMTIWSGLAGEGSVEAIGGLLPAEAANDASIEVETGEEAFTWQGPTFAKANDGVYTTRDLFPGVCTQFLKVTKFGIVLPAGAEPVGVAFGVKKKVKAVGAFTAQVKDKAARLVKGGVIGALADDRKLAALWATTDEETVYGGPLDLFGTTLTKADVESNNFGFAFSAEDVGTGAMTVSVDVVRATVYYTLAATAGVRPRIFAAHGKSIYWTGPGSDEDADLREPNYQVGFYDLGNVDEKTMTNVKIWGTGDINLQVAEDFGDVGEVIPFGLGTAPDVGQDQQNADQAATLFSHRISGPGPWSVHRISRYKREDRGPASKKN